MKKFPKPAVVFVLLLICIGVVFARKVCPNCGATNKDDAKYCKSCGYKFEKTGTSSRPLIRARVSVVSGVVEVKSIPENARVNIDGRSRGTTPLHIENLTPGQHELKLSKSGYRSYYGIFVIPKVLGTIVVTTIPSGAGIFLDGKSKGAASDSGLIIKDVPFGSHLLVAQLSGYEKEVRTVQLSRKQPLSVTAVKFKPQQGFLRVESDPSHAEFIINGKRVGSTSYFGSLEPARYQLSIAKLGFKEWSGYADVRRAETTFVFAPLVHLRPRKPAFLWVGLASLVGGGGGAVMGQLEYSKYQKAATPTDAERFRNSTQTWDLVRNIAAGIGALSIGAYILF